MPLGHWSEESVPYNKSQSDGVSQIYVAELNTIMYAGLLQPQWLNIAC